MREWVSAPPIWLGATKMLEREAEEEARQAQAAAQPDIAAFWNTAFPWVGPAPTLIDLTGPDADAAADEDA